MISKSDEPLFRALFQTAINESRCTELWECLTEGGSATIDAITGKLVMVTGDQLSQMFGD
jgi:hypothetical protein